ncbi:UNVERIFIED_ORG: phosphatidylserine/phosphatidylglycerophosphate/cardiolipin synthase-like enzyme [Paraburkholderia sediminicola]|nr:phosphatidylserine/phosphatidylglycerophosphate/cardiolipin synthase-like enzyme [Paraburkholderia sediminicola]
MKKQIIIAAVAAVLVSAGCLLLVQPARAAADAQVAFSPDGGAKRLVLDTINSAKRSIRVMAYEFTAEPVVRALILARRHGVGVAATVDYRSNIDEDRTGRARAALGALVYAGVPVRVVKAYVIQHEKYLIVDNATIETGS